jgi:hypothetical protein
MAKMSLPPDGPAAPMLEEVEKATRKAADLVQQILAYAGKGRFLIEPVDLTSRKCCRQGRTHSSKSRTPVAA